MSSKLHPRFTLRPSSWIIVPIPESTPMSLAHPETLPHGLVPPEAAPLFTEMKPPLADDARPCSRPTAAWSAADPAPPAPCAAACPAMVDVPHFIDAIAHDDWEGAAELIFRSNLLGASCARVCPTEELCEGACVLTRQGRRPIEIGRLQRYATDMALQNPWSTFRTPAPATGKRVVVIGAGPAGLVCAGELAILGHQVRIYEARPETGGLVRYAIAPYRLDQEPLEDEVRRILALGVELYRGSAGGFPRGAAPHRGRGRRRLPRRGHGAGCRPAVSRAMTCPGCGTRSTSSKRSSSST